MKITMGMVIKIQEVSNMKALSKERRKGIIKYIKGRLIPARVARIEIQYGRLDKMSDAMLLKVSKYASR